MYSDTSSYSLNSNAILPKTILASVDISTILAKIAKWQSPLVKH
ncbi:hypothetical protein LDG_6423 [Legionella drancourtii LLAP12]|uniref:Uncharacterized protein n=1 Tax=Legionella drancourtii LLAP12 TaxID=658187 RepID=G9EMF7_9GAMM|nr:hypothetical protein LDG_6423 [Legionella drancourtii LLAP12]